MGLKNYFKADGRPPAEHAEAQETNQSTPTKRSVESVPMDRFDTYDEKFTPSSTPRPYANNSSRASLTGSSRSGAVRSTMMEDIRHEVMVNYLFQQQCSSMWMGSGSGEAEGVLVRKSRGRYLSCPPNLLQSSFAAGVVALNLPCAMTINSRVVKTFLAWSPDAVDVPLKNGLRVQVLPSMDELPRARKAQSAAFIASEGLLIVWDDGMRMPEQMPIELALMRDRCDESYPTWPSDRRRADGPGLEDWRPDAGGGRSRRR